MTNLDLATLRSAVEWVDGHLEVIDQTRLPERLEVVRLATVDAVVDAIARLVVRGAPAIGACGAFGVVVGLDEATPTDRRSALTVLGDLERRLSGARPTAVNLPRAVGRVRRAAAAGRDPADIRTRALAEAQAVAEDDREACRRIGEHGARELGARTRVLTHCNTGRLATCGIGTALGVVYTMAARGLPVEVLAPETRPLLQGARLTAFELTEAGIPVRVLADGAGPAAVAGGLVDAVVVGADRVARNGDVANKIGTYAHALAAREAGLDFYVAAPLSSFDPDVATGRDIAIEERDAGEVVALRGARIAPPGAGAWNPAFDITPHRLVTAFITEVGLLRPPFQKSITGALGAGATAH